MTQHDSRISERLAVCTWSLEPESPSDLIAKLSATGLKRAQLELDPMRKSPELWGGVAEVLERNGVKVVSGMVRCLDEDYSTLESIRVTGGIAPDGTWEQNLKDFGASAEIAARLGMKMITLHAGFFPHKGSEGYEKMMLRLRTVADLFAGKGIKLGLETGQESAGELAAFLKELGHANVGVNFDPANMILYGKGDPVEAVRVLAPWLLQVHIKDATLATKAGEWGEEVPVGAGDVNWKAFLAALEEVPFVGDLVIEREAGRQRVADIVKARDLMRTFDEK